MLVEETAIADILACPACRGPLTGNSVAGWRCGTADCVTQAGVFPQAGGRSILVDFSTSVLDRGSMLASGADSLVWRHGAWRAKVFAMIDGPNPITPRYAREMLDACRALAAKEGRRARLLIVGGGTIGSGADALYAAEDVDLISFDIYASPHVTLLADGHAMPIVDGAVDGVWIQAVLEHVIDPIRVVAEITRVLRPGGMVFADTPFLWPVHEKAYDFTRWTPNGHRWLFRNFDVCAAGTSSGPGTLSLLALRHMLASLFRSTKMGQILSFPFIWLRLLDRLCDSRNGLNAAAGIFFFGRKAEQPISVSDLIAFYEEQTRYQDTAYAQRPERL